MLHATTYSGHRIVSDRELGEYQLHRLLDIFRRGARVDHPSLDGRAQVILEAVDGIGRVAVKKYTRGGFIKRFVRHHYLRIGRSRCQKEYEMLAGLSRAGISVPRPVAYACRGLLFYCGWLITREIVHSVNLANLARENDGRARMLLGAVAVQIRRLMEKRVVHVDLHPGNVLVDDRDRVFLVDFDRARTVGWSHGKMCRHYLRRWDRAVRKHGLPSFLSDGLHAALRCRADRHSA